MTIYYQDDHVALYHGDCLDVLASMPDSSVDSIVTDPPYGLSNTTPDQVAETITRWVSGDREYLPTGRGFMGKEWDGFVPPVAVWDECLRVLKPGGHMAVFAGSRTHDLMTLSIRFAGFEIRDSLAWLYGSGFPKSMDVGKAIDKYNGNPIAFREFATAYREAVAKSGLTHSAIDKALGIKSSSCYWARDDHRGGMPPRHHWKKIRDLVYIPKELERLYDEAERQVVGVQKGAMSGWNMDGTTKFADRNITTPATSEAQRWTGWGTALKPAFEPIVLARKPLEGTVARNVLEHGTGGINIDACRIGRAEGDRTNYGRGRDLPHANTTASLGKFAKVTAYEPSASGRWPANVLLDEHAAAWVDEQSGVLKSGERKAGQPRNAKSKSSYSLNNETVNSFPPSEGGASRFFYCAKAPKSERPNVDGLQHPTVKPLAIMRWLIRLVTPPGGTVLDPFAGSGTTIEAAMIEGFHPVGIEKETDYLPLITARITRAKTTAQGVLDLGGIA